LGGGFIEGSKDLKGYFIRLRRRPRALPWMNADCAVRSFVCRWLMLWRIALLADTPPKPWARVLENFTADGAGGYLTEVPWALPVGLHKSI